jgi:hypothetical protein
LQNKPKYAPPLTPEDSSGTLPPLATRKNEPTVKDRPEKIKPLLPAAQVFSEKANRENRDQTNPSRPAVQFRAAAARHSPAPPKQQLTQGVSDSGNCLRAILQNKANRRTSYRTKPTGGGLLGFAVRLVLPAVRTELLHLEAFRRGFLILRVRIVPVFALGALERDDFSWHKLPLQRTKRPLRGSRFAHFLVKPN